MVDDPELIELSRDGSNRDTLKSMDFEGLPNHQGILLLKLLKILTASGETRSWNLWMLLIATFRIQSVTADKPFLMPVEDVFTITGRGTVATGRVERGTLHLNDEVEIVGIKEETT